MPVPPRTVRENCIARTDLTRFAELVALAESAIFLRFQQLDDSPTDQQERKAMQDAADNLLSIKKREIEVSAHSQMTVQRRRLVRVDGHQLANRRNKRRP